MKTSLFILVITSLVFSSCYTPINLAYDSARTLKKGQVEVQGSYSVYGIGIPSDDIYSNENFGGRISYGVSDKFNLKLRYEQSRLDENIFSFIELEDKVALNYIEMEAKLGLVPNKIAFGIPVGYYFEKHCNTCGTYVIDPRAYFTFFGSTNKIELSLIPKLHILFTSDEIATMPGFSVGLGLSTNLKKWSIRPEIGYDYGISYGVGLNMNLNEVFLGKR